MIFKELLEYFNIEESFPDYLLEQTFNKVFLDGEFTKEALEGPLEEYIRGNEWPMGKVMNCLRLALVGASSGLGIADIVTLIGKEEFAKRIEFIKATL